MRVRKSSPTDHVHQYQYGHRCGINAPERRERVDVENGDNDEAHQIANAITVVVSGNAVTLTGAVRSWAERREAERAAWASPHVTDVHDRITVQPLH